MSREVRTARQCALYDLEIALGQLASSGIDLRCSVVVEGRARVFGESRRAQRLRIGAGRNPADAVYLLGNFIRQKPVVDRHHGARSPCGYGDRDQHVILTLADIVRRAQAVLRVRSIDVRRARLVGRRKHEVAAGRHVDGEIRLPAYQLHGMDFRGIDVRGKYGHRRYELGGKGNRALDRPRAGTGAEAERHHGRLDQARENLIPQGGDSPKNSIRPSW